MNSCTQVSRNEYTRLVNKAIRRHRRYRKGMMVQMVPREINPDGILIVIRVPDVAEVVAEAVAEVNGKWCAET